MGGVIRNVIIPNILIPAGIDMEDVARFVIVGFRVIISTINAGCRDIGLIDRSGSQIIGNMIKNGYPDVGNPVVSPHLVMVTTITAITTMATPTVHHGRIIEVVGCPQQYPIREEADLFPMDTLTPMGSGFPTGSKEVLHLLSVVRCF